MQNQVYDFMIPIRASIYDLILEWISWFNPGNKSQLTFEIKFKYLYLSSWHSLNYLTVLGLTNTSDFLVIVHTFKQVTDAV